MKITYPECQIEISTEEVIDLLDYFEDREPKIECRHGFSHLNYKKPELYKPEISEEVKKEIEESLREYLKERGPAFNPFRSTESDSQPDPNPYPNLTDQEAIIPRQDVGGPISSVRFNIGKPNPYPTKEVPAPVEIPKECKNESTKKKKASGKPKKVDILFTTGWKTFDSVSEAAKSIGINYKTFYSNLTHGKPCNGHQVRYHSEMDDIMAEINESNRKPYEPSKPVR